MQTEVKSFHLDNRQPGKRKQMIEFWQEVLLSAADQLVAADKIDTATVEGMRAELQAVRNDPNAVVLFCLRAGASAGLLRAAHHPASFDDCSSSV